MAGSLANGRPKISVVSGVQTMPMYEEYTAVTFAVVANRVRLQVTGCTETQLRSLVDKYLLADDGAETSEVRLVNEVQVVDGTPDTYFVIISEPFTVAAASYDLLYVDPINAQLTNTVLAGVEAVYVDGVEAIAAGQEVTFNPAEPYRPLVLYSDYPYKLSNGTFFFDGGVGGGGIESVTAENASIVVDNTDPLNPVVGLPYLVYRALLSQSGTDAPTAIVLENTLGETPTFSYAGAGTYGLNTVGNVFTTNKTFVMLNPYSEGNDTTVVNTATKAGGNTVQLNSYLSNVGADGLLLFSEIEILVYP